MSDDIGYLQHRASDVGPFRTEAVKVRHRFLDQYEAHFEGRWRMVHIQLKRCYIVYQHERITIQIDGV